MTSSDSLPPSSHAKPVDSFARSAELERELRRSVQGEVRFDRGSRALYATDASNYRQVPIGVVIPRHAEDVSATLACCRKFDAPVLSRGAGTSLAGQCCNVAVVLDFTKYMDRILELNPEARIARVQPGVVLDMLRSQAEIHHLTFAPDPSTHNRCTIGGMIGNNSCGSHSLMGGKTVDNVEELRILLYDGTELTVGAATEMEIDNLISQGGRRGEIYQKLKNIRNQYGELVRARFPKIPRRVSGYNLDELLPERGFHVARSLVGSEGTCAVVLEAKLKLIPSPSHRTLIGLGYADAFEAADHVPEILEFNPIALEGFEGSIVDALRAKGAANLQLLPPGQGFLLVEFGSDDSNGAESQARRLMERLAGGPAAPSMRLYTSQEAKFVWQIRESGPRAAAFARGAVPEWEGWDDSAVAPHQLGSYLRELRKLMDQYGYRGAFYGHFGHACIHMRVSFNLESTDGIQKYARFINNAADLVIRYGGSLSGEHGDGQSRGALLPKMFGPGLMQAFAEFKSAWDPQNRMNPNKLIQAPAATEDLRFGADYRPLEPKTHFSFPDDQGSFASAAARCIGLGACRKRDAGTMCPSYMVTGEEEHSTRGRAHLLFELLQGEVIKAGWSDEHVKRSLDLCLSCKACKSECPANVDVASYRAEFLSHYFETHSRPLHAYAFGLLDEWASKASRFATAVNFLSDAPGLGKMIRNVLHVSSSRRLPKLATESFQRWAVQTKIPALENRRAGKHEARLAGRHVVLWVDTFSNYFHPRIARAAYEVLTRAGFQVLISQQHYCCGRPLYDFGMLDRAKAYLARILDGFSEEIAAGLPFVVLEPSCASVFRDELRNLLPNDERARQLKEQTFLLGEFLQRHGDSYAPPHLGRKIMLHVHCHQKALMNSGADQALLRRMGAEVQALDSGCCGMAGSFGFRDDAYQVSQALAERVLLPAIRRAQPDTLIVSDGFSCREQVFQNTGRRALHLAEVLRLADSSQSESNRPIVAATPAAH